MADFAGYNPYEPAMQANLQAEAKRQAMAQKLMAQAPAAPAGFGSGGVDQGTPAMAAHNPLGGIDMRALQAAFAPAKDGAPGVPGQDGYHTGYMGTGGLDGQANTAGADALQQMGLYNPLPQGPAR